jgi:hypothetical protein
MAIAAAGLLNMTMGPSGSTGGLSVGHWISNQAASSSATNVTSTTNVGTGGTTNFAYVTITADGAAVPRPPPIEDAGIRTGEITGYRAWIVRDGMLHSVYWHYTWLPQAVGQAFLSDQSGAGFHAFKTPEKAYIEYITCSGAEDGVVFGEVLLWGKVIEHERGYRAEYARVKCLTHHHTLWPKNRLKFWRPSTLSKLRKLYGV